MEKIDRAATNEDGKYMTECEWAYRVADKIDEIVDVVNELNKTVCSGSVADVDLSVADIPISLIPGSVKIVSVETVRACIDRLIKAGPEIRSRTFSPMTLYGPEARNWLRGYADAVKELGVYQEELIQPNKLSDLIEKNRKQNEAPGGQKGKT